MSATLRGSIGDIWNWRESGTPPPALGQYYLIQEVFEVSDRITDTSGAFLGYIDCDYTEYVGGNYFLTDQDFYFDVTNKDDTYNEPSNYGDISSTLGSIINKTTVYVESTGNIVQFGIGSIIDDSEQWAYYRLELEIQGPGEYFIVDYSEVYKNRSSTNSVIDRVLIDVHPSGLFACVNTEETNMVTFEIRANLDFLEMDSTLSLAEYTDGPLSDNPYGVFVNSPTESPVVFLYEEGTIVLVDFRSFDILDFKPAGDFIISYKQISISPDRSKVMVLGDGGCSNVTTGFSIDTSSMQLSDPVYVDGFFLTEGLAGVFWSHDSAVIRYYDQDTVYMWEFSETSGEFTADEVWTNNLVGDFLGFFTPVWINGDIEFIDPSQCAIDV